MLGYDGTSPVVGILSLFCSWGIRLYHPNPIEVGTALIHSWFGWGPSLQRVCKDDTDRQGPVP